MARQYRPERKWALTPSLPSAPVHRRCHSRSLKMRFAFPAIRFRVRRRGTEKDRMKNRAKPCVIRVSSLRFGAAKTRAIHARITGVKFVGKVSQCSGGLPGVAREQRYNGCGSARRSRQDGSPSVRPLPLRTEPYHRRRHVPAPRRFAEPLARNDTLTGSRL